LLDQGHFAEARLAAMRVMQDGEQNSKAILIEAKALRGTVPGVPTGSNARDWNLHAN